jgi:methionyl-tRNA formyltransferase
METPVHDMKVTGVLLLVPASEALWMREAIGRLDPDIAILEAHDATQLETCAARLDDRWLFLSFGTGVIVAPSTLDAVAGRAVNFHSAPPAYPGRDPQHFAANDGVAKYGATAHLMVKQVDAGKILATRMQSVAVSATPEQLLEVGNAAARELVLEMLPRLLSGVEMELSDQQWGKAK